MTSFLNLSLTSLTLFHTGGGGGRFCPPSPMVFKFGTQSEMGKIYHKKQNRIQYEYISKTSSLNFVSDKLNPIPHWGGGGGRFCPPSPMVFKFGAQSEMGKIYHKKQNRIQYEYISMTSSLNFVSDKLSPIPHGEGRFYPPSDCLLYNFSKGCNRTTNFGDLF